MGKKNHRFHAIYLISIFTFFAICLSLAGYFYYYQQKQRLLQLAKDNLSSIAKLKAGQIENWRQERFNDASFIFHNEAISMQFEQFLKKPIGRKERDAMLGWMTPMFKNQQYISMDLFSLSGRHLFNILNDSNKASVYENGVIKEAIRIKKVLFVDLHVHNTGGVYMGLIVPLIKIGKRDTTVLGSVLLRIDPWRFLYPLIHSWPVISKSSETLILRREGDEIVYLNELRHRREKSLALRISINEKKLPAAIAARGYEGVVEGIDYRQEEVVAAVRQISNSPWYMVAKTDVDEVLAENMRIAIGVTFGTTLILLLLASGIRMIWKEQEVKQYQVLLESQQERQALIQHFDYLMRYANDVIFLSNEEQRIIEANERAEHTYGYNHEELLNLHIADIWEMKSPSELHDRLKSMMAPSGALYETYHRRKDGSIFPVEISGRTITVEGKTYYQEIIRDTTERKEAEKILREREKQLLLVTNNFPGLVSTVDKDLRYQFASAGYERIFGILSVDVIGLTMRQVLGNETFKQVEPYIEQAFAGEQVTFVNPIKTPIGDVSYELTTYIPDTDAEGRVQGIFIFAIDINERIEMEDALRRAEENFRRSLDDSPLGVRIVSSAGETLYANKAVLDIYGYSNQEDLKRTPIKERYTSESYDEFKKRKEQRDRGEFGPSEYEISIVKKNGEVRHVQVFRKEVLWNGVKQFQVIYQDITQRKLLEEPLRRMQKLEGLGTLAGGIAHDFNNILGIILGYISRINIIKNDSEKLQHSIEIITKAVERGTTLVRQILTFARKTETEFHWVNVNGVAKEVMGMIMETFPKTIMYSQNLEKEIPSIYADHSQLHQALLNLCVNARDAMQSGGVLTINTSLLTGSNVRNRHPEAESNRYICIEVVDTGAGMVADVRNRIFEPFFTTKEKGKGTGLGLAVVFGIVQTHHGFVDVESELGKGATFRLYLPISHEIENLEAAKKETVDEIRGGTETLLIVEDEETLNENLNATLAGKGYTVLSAFDGLTAVDIYTKRQKEVALVLTDLGLPKMTGMEEFNRIKQLNPNVRIIVATGYLDPEMRSELLKAGVQKFIYKPYNPKEVLRAVRELLDSK
jgi:two-component system, cell cycle sensor histidine kinase and response regulator CckA